MNRVQRRPVKAVGLQRGFAAIGLVNPKCADNVGGVMRAAFCYGVAYVAIDGARVPVTSAADTPRAHRHIPVVRGNDILSLAPVGAQVVAVDIIDGAEPLPDFRHPQSAFYLFGPEDGTLNASLVARCQHVVMVPTAISMNLAATVNVVLYDRLSKQLNKSEAVAA